MTVGSAAQLLVATVPNGQTFTVVIDPDTALEEIVDVTNWSSGNTLTIERGVDGSTGVPHSAGAVVRHMAIGRDYREANVHIENTETAHGLTLANLVKTTDTGVVTSAMITNGAIVDADVNASAAIAKTKISGTAITAADTATVTATILAADSVTTAKIAELAVTNSRLASDAVTADKIAADAVGTSEIIDSSVTSAKIANDTIINADINSAAAIAATKIAGTAVTQADTGTVTSTMIANGTIVNADISDTAAIAKTKLNLGGTITSADLVDGTIVASDIANATITADKLAVDPYARANHTGTQTASTVSDFDTQVRTSKLNQMAAPTSAVAMNAQKITGLGLAVSDGDAVSVDWINSQKGAVNGIAELDGSGLVPTHHLPALAITTTQVVNSQANMLALTAQVGDVAVRTDVNKSFILTATPASTLANWQELLTPTDAVLSVDGSTGAITLSGTYLAKAGDTMTGDLTLAGAPSSNLHAATKAYVDTVAGSATAAAASAAAAATTYDNFDDRYLGAKSTEPTLDNDGNTLLTGAIYWNSVANAMFAWSGSAWGSISSTAAIYRYRFNATGGETSVSGSDANGLTLSYLVGKAQVYLNGILLVPTTDYSATNGTSITSLAALASGDVLEVITFTSFELASAIEETIFDAKGDLLVGISADTVGKLTVGSNNMVLVADSSTATGLKWSAYDPLPSQTGNTGKVLTTNGSTTSWEPGLPTQTGNTGKYLTTDGTSASWSAVQADATPTVFLLMGA